MRILPRLVAASLMVSACAPSSRAGDGSPSAAQATVLAFSEALARPDTAALRRIATPTFALLEDGRVYDLPATQAAVLAVLAGGRMTRTLDGFKTVVRGNTAWTHYRVTGEFRGPGDTTQVRFIESAVLEWIGSEWRIALMTAMPEAPGS